MKEDRYEFNLDEWDYRSGGPDEADIILTRKKGDADAGTSKEEIHRINQAIYSLGFIWGALQLYIKDDRPRLDLEYHVEVVQKQIFRSMSDDKDSPS